MTRESFIASLRAVADFYETHETVHLPNLTALNVFEYHTRADLASLLPELGSVVKTYPVRFDLLYVDKPFGDIILRFIFTKSAVCRRVVVGTREVPTKTIPEQVFPAHTEDIVEWDCSAPLMGEERGGNEAES